MASGGTPITGPPSNSMDAVGDGNALISANGRLPASNIPGQALQLMHPHLKTLWHLEVGGSSSSLL
jgi:hypothetical protein